MLLRRLLQFAAFVASLPGEIQLRILQFVVIERKLGLRQFELSRRPIAGFGVFGEFRDARLVRGDLRFGLRDTRVELLNGAAGGRLDGGRFAYRGGEGLVQFMIRVAHGLLSEIDLLLRFGDACHLARGIEQPAVHHRHLHGRASRRGVAGEPGGYQASRQHKDYDARRRFWPIASCESPCHANL